MKIERLTELGTNKQAIIREIQGGSGPVSRLDSMGIRPGVKITKLSSHFWRGPVTVLVGKAKIAVGHGVAHKILVEVSE